MDSLIEVGVSGMQRIILKARDLRKQEYVTCCILLLLCCQKFTVKSRKVTAREEQSLLKINMRKTSDSKVEFYVDGKISSCVIPVHVCLEPNFDFRISLTRNRSRTNEI